MKKLIDSSDPNPIFFGKSTLSHNAARGPNFLHFYRREFSDIGSYLSNKRRNPFIDMFLCLLASSVCNRCGLSCRNRNTPLSRFRQFRYVFWRLFSATQRCGSFGSAFRGLFFSDMCSGHFFPHFWRRGIARRTISPVCEISQTATVLSVMCNPISLRSRIVAYPRFYYLHQWTQIRGQQLLNPMVFICLHFFREVNMRIKSFEGIHRPAYISNVRGTGINQNIYMPSGWRIAHV